MTMARDIELRLSAEPVVPVRRDRGELVDELISSGAFGVLMDRIGEDAGQLTGDGGFLPALIKAVLERGLAAELSDHLGYENGDPAGRGLTELAQRDDPQDGRFGGR